MSITKLVATFIATAFLLVVCFECQGQLVIDPAIVPQSQVPPLGIVGELEVPTSPVPPALGTIQRASPPPSLAKPKEPSEQIIDEIKAIRKQMGGGIAEQLKGLGYDGSNWDQQVEAEFENELHRLNRNPLNGNQIKPKLIQPNHGQANLLPTQTLPVPRFKGRNSRYEIPKVSANNNTPWANGLPQPKTKLEQLQDAASQLDQMAAQFEKSELFEEADLIREQARKFWLKARELK